MPRPARQSGWSPITLTISDEIATALRVRAAVTGEEIGQIADQILRATLESFLEPVKALTASLQIRPLLPGNASSAPKPPAPSDSLSIPEKQVVAEPISPRSFADPSVRAEYEARFLEEALESARRDLGWDHLLERLKYNDVESHAMGGHLIRAESIEQEIESWVAAKRVPTRWKERLFYELGGGDSTVADIFGSGLGPDDFFEWEQPGI